MGIEPTILFGKVMHGRLFPKRNHFTYGIYYLSFPLSKRSSLPIAYNRFALLSFYERDHGACDGSDIEKWARSILEEYGIDKADGEIVLVCMPRVFGYVFNPVSFWLCHDKSGYIIAILCEVHNTFREKHTYLCAHKNQKAISCNDTLNGEKVFHVSPFLKREGNYIFRFDIRDSKFSTWIDFYNKDNKKQLVTSLVGHMKPMNRTYLSRAFWRYPAVTLKAIVLIHWQALKLFAKGIKYIPKPFQKQDRTSATDNLTKM